MLSNIEHPTGAKEAFVWEANKARIEDRFFDTGNSVFRITEELDGKDGIYIMGGLRIKEINIIENGECKLKEPSNMERRKTVLELRLYETASTTLYVPKPRFMTIS